MKRTTLVKWIGFAAIAVLPLAGTTAPSRADEPDFAVTGHAGVRVWVDGGDVFSDYDDVSVYVRAESDCYATLLLVDTDGYLHVLYPSSPYDRLWLRGGRTYHYSAWELGIHHLDGVGIAHLYAVGSPVPFDYSYYGASVFIGGFGFRIYGDPYIACRDFYVSLLPASCRWDFVSVGCARFYVRRWVRYPSYLCTPGVGVHVWIGDRCRACTNVYASYRVHAASPYEVLRPVPKFKGAYAPAYARDRDVATLGRVQRVRPRAVKHEARGDRRPAGGGVARVVERTPTGAIERSPQRRGVVRAKSVEPVKVVSTSRSGETARSAVKVLDPRVKASPGRVAAPVRARDVMGSKVSRVAAPGRAHAEQRAVQRNVKSTGKKIESRQKGVSKRAREAR